MNDEKTSKNSDVKMTPNGIGSAQIPSWWVDANGNITKVTNNNKKRLRIVRWI